MSRSLQRRLVLGLCLLAFATAGQAQQVLQHKGLDARVDYAKLVEIGPWDDRNYQLTQKDLSLLAPNENELRAQIPAFFRVEMRRANPGMQRTGPAQYPRSALQIFRLEYGGYLVNGKLYPGAEYEDGRYSVLMKQGITEEHFAMEKFLTGEVRITSPNGAAESAIKINPVNTDLVIAGSNGPGSGQIMHFSTDGGENWSTAAALPNGGTCCDPTVDWSSDGTLAYAATLGNCGGGGCQIWVYRSSDGGQTWNDLPGSPPRRTLNTGGGNDKEFIHVDKFTTSPFVDNIYATWHANNVMQFSRSSDSGETWATQAFSSASDQLGIGSDIVTDQSGAVYYFWPAFNSQRILLRKSTDGGASFGSVIEVDSTEASFTFPVPSMDTRDVFVYVSADADLSTGPFGGSIYAAWTDSTGPTGNNASNNHARIQVGYSRDGGNTWTVTTPHETADSNSVDRWHQWLAVGPDGQVHVVFYDTRRDPSRSSVDLFYSFSSDGAQTWSTPTRITAQQSPNIGDSFEFGDYNGLDIVLNDMIAIFTDNRNEGGGGADSVDVYAAGIPVTGGCTPQAVADAGADRTINEGDSTTLGTPALGGHTYSWSPGGATTAQISVSPTTSTTYTVTATTSCGSANDSVTVTVIPAGGGGPQTAVFNAGLGAPACLTPGSSCDSTTLLVGRDGNGPEPNQPNTLDGCADGTSGTFQSDESNDSLFVTTLDGSNMVEGATVRIDAEVWAWTTPAEDTLDLFFTADANNPSWTLITSITPTVVGQQTLSATYTLPAGALQAVRAQFRYQSTNAPCSAGNWNDRDDLVFAVGTAAGCSVNADCDDGAFCNGAETCNTGTGVCEAGTPPVCDDGVSCTVDSCNEATDSCDAAPNDSLCDNGLFCDGAETCDAINDCQAGTAPNCNDGVSCTVDSCNEGTDSCDNTPDDSVCDNGLFCDGAETCDVVNDCQAGTNPCSGSQTCNETADICEGGGGCLHDVDFESGAGGWTGNTGSCTTGDFIVGTPDATAWQLGAGNPGQAFFTANNPGGIGTDDVDGGTCIALSPSINANGEAAVSVSLDYYHGQRDAGDDAADGFTVEVLNNGSVVGTLVSIGDVTNNPAWSNVSTTVVNPGNIQVRVSASDAAGPGDIVEAGIDNVQVCPTTPPVGCTVEEDFSGGLAGWVNTAASTCSTGTFVSAAPTQQTSGGVVTQVGGDHTGGGNALFTATNASAGNADVDGGVCIVESPVFAVADASDLSIWYFHGQRDAGDDAAGDFFLLEVSTNGGASYSPLVSLGDVQNVAAWTEATTTIPAGSDVRLRVQVSDGAGPGDIVEGGVDDLSICPQ